MASEAAVVIRRPMPEVRQNTKRVLRAIEQLKCFEEIRKWLMKGATPRAVSKIPHQRGEWKDVPVRTIEDRLSIYVALRIKDNRAIERYAPKSLKDRLQMAQMIADELEELGELYEIQKTRIKGFREQEAKINLPLKHIDESILVALRLVESSSSMKQELGINKRVPLEVHHNVESRVAAVAEARYGKESVARVLADPVKRSKVAHIAEKLLLSPVLQAAAQRMLGDEAKQAGAAEDAADDDVSSGR